MGVCGWLRNRKGERGKVGERCVCTHKMCLFYTQDVFVYIFNTRCVLCTFLRSFKHYVDRPICRKMVFWRRFAAFCARLQALGKQLEFRTPQQSGTPKQQQNGARRAELRVAGGSCSLPLRAPFFFLRQPKIDAGDVFEMGTSLRRGRL